MTKIKEKAYEAYPVCFYEGTTVDVNEMPREVFIEGYHQAIADACEWIKQQQEMLDDCFSDAGDFADLLKQAMEE